MTHFSVSRRRFVKAASLSGAVVAIGTTPWRQLAGAEKSDTVLLTPTPPSTPTWIDKPMRWAQLTLVEDDPGKFDPQFWLDYFKRTKSDAVCLSAGGCVAYYPTTVPFHHRSQWLGGSDPFGDLVKGCRDLGMVVIARTDPHATYDDVQKAHPDWIAVTVNGEPRRHWASPEMWVACARRKCVYWQTTSGRTPNETGRISPSPCRACSIIKSSPWICERTSLFSVGSTGFGVGVDREDSRN